MKKSILAIALGFSATASMAGDPVASMTAPQIKTDDVSITGAYDIGIKATDGNKIDLSGKNISVDITQGSGLGGGTVGVRAWAADSSASTINLGKQGTTESITVKVTDNSGKAKDNNGHWAVAVGIHAQGKMNAKGGIIDINTKSLIVDVNSTAWAYGLYSQNVTSTATSDFSKLTINADNIHCQASSELTPENVV